MTSTDRIIAAERTACIARNTKETRISAQINLDGTGQCKCSTGIGFFDHMLDQIARHALMDLEINAEGDLHIDAHHCVEDVGIVLGQAFKQAVAEPKGIFRYGWALVPLDEALSQVSVDLSGRPGLFLRARFTRDRIGDFDLQLVSEFFRAFVNHAGVTLHMDVLQGENAHHMVECLFKAFARALRQSVTRDERAPQAIPSTKGSL
ncbi:MAG: imidazoleglycerol-phosphate dehydratase HisB [Gammaproteobacteria bacterium]